MQLRLLFFLFFLVSSTFSASLSGRDTCNNLKSIPLRDIPVPSFPPFDPDLAQIMRYRKQVSVNLGSWFVLERWMSPSMFTSVSGQSELDVASAFDPSCSRRLLERHWARHMNDSDFAYLASIGVNTVRLPLGYWTLGPEYCKDTPFDSVAPVYRNAWSFLVNAINQAAAHNLGVLIDLHGAVGSQNGQPHSGTSDRRVGLFNSPSNVAKTISVLTYLTQQLSNVSNVVGIQILNEPQDNPKLSDFYTKAITAMRAVSPSAQTLPLYIHDGFNFQKFSKFVAKRSDFVVLDYHSYFVFTSQDANDSAYNLTQKVTRSVQPMLANANLRGNLVVGEWSCALTPRSLSYEKDKEAARRSFCNTQLDVYSSVAAGWSFWSYQLEQCNLDWCFLADVGRILPSDFSQSSDACGLQQTDDDGGLFRRVDHEAHRFSTRRKRQSYDAHQKSQAKGYSDGMDAVRRFCASNSQLGFAEQFVHDQIQALGPDVVAPGTESDYKQGFFQGMEDGRGGQ
ncbi:Glycoside hydrolase [Mycena indigotica]|uniref:Glycoside hydrolase n=1 Tax=Mycena indigotica TaxID=2126181 RepID=A0A8H6SB13_9AGAR|nr:Glycoside hydrolase [Mycena indigotica]KAF7295032.1 Glycoside hydrolase [Mycena indigotica]